MAQQTALSRKKFDQWDQAYSDALRANDLAWDAANEAGNHVRVQQLDAARRDLRSQRRKLANARAVYTASQIGKSKAEKALGIRSDKSKKIVDKIKKVADVLNSVGKLAKNLTELVAILKPGA